MAEKKTQPEKKTKNPPTRARLAFQAMTRVEKAQKKLASAKKAEAKARKRVKDAEAELTAAQNDAAQYADLTGGKVA